MPARTAQPDFFSQDVNQARRFFLDLAPPEDVPLAVVSGGLEKCAADYAIRRETFPYYSIELVTQGKGTLLMQGVEHKLRPGVVFAYGPGVPHRFATDQRARLAKYFVNFTGGESIELLRQAELEPGKCATVSPVGEVQLLMNELLRDGARGGSLSPRLCVALLRSLSLRIAAHLTRTSSGRAESFATYQRCIEHIEACAHRLTSLAQLAHECGVDPSYLSRLFQRHGRQTPYQHLTRVRMNLAAERLLDSADRVGTVAAELGYQDPFHFSRTFKATFGLSPSEFRALH